MDGRIAYVWTDTVYTRYADLTNQLASTIIPLPIENNTP